MSMTRSIMSSSPQITYTVSFLIVLSNFTGFHVLALMHEFAQLHSICSNKRLHDCRKSVFFCS